MKLLALGDLMGKLRLLKRLLEMDLSTYDLVILTGDLPDPTLVKKLGWQKVLETKDKSKVKKNIDELLYETKEYKQAVLDLERQFREMEKIFGLLSKKVRIIGVWGNADHREIVEKIPIEKHFEIIHNKVLSVGEYAFVGYNGRPLYVFEKENFPCWAFSEEQIEKDLSRIFSQLKERQVILVTHTPPYQILDQVNPRFVDYAMATYSERAKNCHIGSIGLNGVVEKYKPFLHLFSHIHEGKGVLRNETCFVNTGSAGEENEICEINLEGKTIRVRFLKL